MSIGKARQIYDIMMQAIENKAVPDGYYGPETMRWGTPGDMEHLGLREVPLVHLNDAGDIDCYFLPDRAVIVNTN